MSRRSQAQILVDVATQQAFDALHRSTALERALEVGRQDADAALPFNPQRFHDPQLQAQYCIGYGQVCA